MPICLLRGVNHGTGDDGDVIDAASLNRCSDQCLGRVMGIVKAGAHGVENLLVGQHSGETVGTE